VGALYYGDNLDILRRYLGSIERPTSAASVD
jgi:hypothetical protein